MQYDIDDLANGTCAIKQGVGGQIYAYNATMSVDKNGTISEIKVVKSVDSSLDREAIRIVSRMPNWIPGKREGEPVRVKYTLPVNFRLQ